MADNIRTTLVMNYALVHTETYNSCYFRDNNLRLLLTIGACTKGYSNWSVWVPV